MIGYYVTKTVYERNLRSQIESDLNAKTESNNLLIGFEKCSDVLNTKAHELLKVGY